MAKKLDNIDNLKVFVIGFSNIPEEKEELEFIKNGLAKHAKQVTAYDVKDSEGLEKKGMTLIEVVIALFLLGLITIVFLPSIWSSYKMMKKAKNYSRYFCYTTKCRTKVGRV